MFRGFFKKQFQRRKINMSGKSAKSIRKQVARQTEKYLNGEQLLIFKQLQEQSIFYRVQFAFRLIFKRLLVKKTVEIPEWFAQNRQTKNTGMDGKGFMAGSELPLNRKNLSVIPNGRTQRQRNYSKKF
jgi:hypothetical protein